MKIYTLASIIALIVSSASCNHAYKATIKFDAPSVESVEIVEMPSGLKTTLGANNGIIVHNIRKPKTVDSMIVNVTLGNGKVISYTDKMIIENREIVLSIKNGEFSVKVLNEAFY